MEPGNHTMVTEFIILGLTEDPTLCCIFFVLFLGVYITTILGNVSIIMLIRRSPQLHTPMYLFLSHLAFADMIHWKEVFLHKAFSRWTSLLTAVILYYELIAFIFVVQPNYSVDESNVVECYIVIILMLSHLIYSTRNRDVKQVLKKATIRIYP